MLPRMLLPIQQLIPEFPELFANKKTFHEPFPDCSNKRWDDRLRRTARVHETLSRPDIADIGVRSVLSGAFEELLIALDRYDMHIGACLLEPLNTHGPQREETASARRLPNPRPESGSRTGASMRAAGLP